MSKHLAYAHGNVTASIDQADSADFLQTLDPVSVDLVVTSPPYFIGKEYDPSTHISDFKATITRLLPDIHRILKPGGSVCWQVGNYVSSNEIVPLDYVTARAMTKAPAFHLRNRIIWAYSHGNHERRRFSGRHETILWYTKGNDYYFDLDLVRIPQKYPGKRHYKGPNRGSYSGNPQGKNPGDLWELGAVWHIPNVKANHPEKTDHPCQYPIALVRRLVLALSPKGGVVLDPFVGSGTTALGSLLVGRNFIGCDITAKYLSITESRLLALTQGRLRFRDDVPIQAPSPNSKVATAPEHFFTQARSTK